MRQPKKTPYRVRNWGEYNAGLVKRGNLSIWIEEDLARAWEEKEKTGERGRPQDYKDSWIELILMLGMVYHLPLRQLEGFVHGRPRYCHTCRHRVDRQA